MSQEDKKVIGRELTLTIIDEMDQAKLQAGEEAGLMSIAHPHPEAIYKIIKNYLFNDIKRKYTGVRY
jgi:hypothetical protein